MRAMVFEKPHEPLRANEHAVPEPGPGQWLLRIHACGVCRTDLHLIDGEIGIASPPRILGHQIIATVEGGDDAPIGKRVGVPWLGWTDGDCEYCLSGRENLCPRARFTGRDIDGGMAQWTVADSRFCLPIPDGYPDEQAAPLLCAGLIGWRALRFVGNAHRLGLYGFGSSAHILTQVAVWQGREVFAFTRPGDAATQAFARELGARWAGGSDEQPPQKLHGAIIFAAAGELVPAALRATATGGAVVCAGIHMSDIPAFPYEILWGERVLRSVANLTRDDAREFLALAARTRISTEIHRYGLDEAPRALEDLRAGRFDGAAVVDLAGERDARAAG